MTLMLSVLTRPLNIGAEIPPFGFSLNLPPFYNKNISHHIKEPYFMNQLHSRSANSPPSNAL